jgi:hypothetical protein
MKSRRKRGAMQLTGMVERRNGFGVSMEKPE